MSTIHIGVGELAVTKTPGEVIKTNTLGSGVAVILLDPVSRAVGVAQIALPDSSIDRSRGAEKPGMFADTAVPLLLEEMKKLSQGGGEGVVVKLVGGAGMLEADQIFNPGQGNLQAVREALGAQGLAVSAEDVEGNISRTVSVVVDDGKVIISSPGRGQWEI